jgi:hypothetical protein
MHDKNEDEEKEDLAEKDSPLGLKDWILFLSSESYQTVESCLLIFAIAVALLASISIVDYGPFLQVIAFVVSMILLFTVSAMVFSAFERKKCMDKIVESIIEGELTDLSTIREQWNKCKKPLIRRRK